MTADPVFETYTTPNFTPDTEEVLWQALQIIEAYAEEGYDLTLRQLYYQFVAKGWLPNTQQNYKRLGDIVEKGRMAGRLPWNRIEDRTRNIQGGGGWDSPRQMAQAIARAYHRDKWETQSNYVEVWVEKQALEGVVDRATRDLNLRWFACRGYVSASEMYAAGLRYRREIDLGRKVHIIHLGDHDPSGVDMTRDVEKRLNQFAHGCVDWAEHAEPVVHVNRIALNMDQVRRFRPPPNPAKTTDARFKGYEAIHGTQSWELDALPPQVLNDLIQEAVEPLIDRAAWNAVVERQEYEREQLNAVATHWDYVRDALGQL